MLITPKLDESPVLSVPRLGPPKEMISTRKLEDGRTLVRINSSSLQVIQECMRKAQYTLHEGWIAKEESPATLFGSAVHAFMEVFYSGRFEERRLPRLVDFELMAAGQRIDGDEEDLCLKSFRAFLKKHEPISELPAEDKRSAANGAWILHHYLKSFIIDPYVAYVDDKGPFLERTFTLKVYEDESRVIEIFGTIDFVFRNLNTNKLIPGDHKTSSFLGFGDSSYFDREKPNHQYTGYIMGCREVFGLDVFEFLVNIIEVKAKPKTERGKGPSFPRQPTSRSLEDIEEFRQAVAYYSTMYEASLKSEIWPMGPVQSCASYGSCSFRAVCSSPKNMRQTILQNKFERKLNAIT